MCDNGWGRMQCVRTYVVYRHGCDPTGINLRSDLRKHLLEISVVAVQHEPIFFFKCSEIPHEPSSKGEGKSRRCKIRSVELSRHSSEVG